MTDPALKACPLCKSAPWPGTSLWGTATAACSSHGCPLGGIEVLAAEWNARPTEDALRAERDAALAERARLRALIAEAAADLPLHPEGAHLTQPEEDAEAVRVALLAALRGEA
jgi:hypothetical protein